MNMNCINCNKPVYQTGVNQRDVETNEIHYDGIEKVYKCEPDEVVKRRTEAMSDYVHKIERWLS